MRPKAKAMGYLIVPATSPASFCIVQLLRNTEILRCAQDESVARVRL